MTPTPTPTPTLTPSSQIPTETVDVCPICGSEGHFKFQDVKDRLFGVPGAWNISQCSALSCGVLWLNPRPTKEEVWKAYTTYYTHSEPGGVQIKPLKQKILSFCQNTLLNSILILTGSFKEKRQLDHLFLKNTPPGRLLEIGCGNGATLKKMKAMGWDVEGADQDKESAQMVQESLNIKVHVGNFETMGLPKESFDAVILKHVVEHLYDIHKMFTEIQRILKPGGKVILITPNTESWGLKHFQKNWQPLDAPRHLILYNQKALEKAAVDGGFLVQYSASSAVNSWLVFSESIELQGKPNETRVRTRPSILSILKAFRLQIPILIKKKFNPLVGDECVLVAEKRAL